MDLLESIKERVRPERRRLLLPETQDGRVLEAAVRIRREGFAQPVLLARPDAIRARLREAGGEAKDFEVLDPADAARLDEFAATYLRLRRHKGVTEDEARETVRDPVFHGALCLRAGLVDGVVCGSASPTPHVIRASLHCIGTREDLKTLSSSLLMVLPHQDFGHEGTLLFSDCAVVPTPTTWQLVDIARGAAASWRQLTGTEPVVAMLSFSTKGSSAHESAARMAEAARRVQKIEPGLVIDGELQVDAALVPEVARLKCPDSPVQGRANVLIFPDLQSGNIGYKLVQRVARARAVGPVLQGLAKPINDLSRGCVVEEIVGVAAITCAQAGAA